MTILSASSGGTLYLLLTRSVAAGDRVRNVSIPAAGAGYVAAA
jgi:hypothetical protein